MRKRAARLWGWIRQHWVWSSILLIVLLVGMGCGLVWTVNVVRFGLPPPKGQECGSIIHSEVPPERTTRADATIQALTCFWHAYQSCRAATMSQTEAATDAWGTDTITIEQRSNHCAIYGQEEDHLNTQTRNITFLCNQLSKEGSTLQLSGCDGVADFALTPRLVVGRPSTFAQESYLCGIVGGAYAYPYRPPQQVESCFFTAYQQCWDDAMQYDTLEQGTEVERDFIIDNRCGIAYLRRPYQGEPNTYTAACASLELRADGLHFMGCGADGDIVVPSAPPGSPA